MTKQDTLILDGLVCSESAPLLPCYHVHEAQHWYLALCWHLNEGTSLQCSCNMCAHAAQLSLLPCVVYSTKPSVQSCICTVLQLKVCSSHPPSSAAAVPPLGSSS